MWCFFWVFFWGGRCLSKWNCKWSRHVKSTIIQVIIERTWIQQRTCTKYKQMFVIQWVHIYRIFRSMVRYNAAQHAHRCRKPTIHVRSIINGIIASIFICENLLFSSPFLPSPFLSFLQVWEKKRYSKFKYRIGERLILGKGRDSNGPVTKNWIHNLRPK